jgi:hypothetical protein
MSAPATPAIYHITHVDNLAGILADGWLWSDAELLRRARNARLIGLSSIKRRRLEELDVTCHPGTKVGDYVPFYFCPRSVMLYVLHRGNLPDLPHSEGQPPIVHLEADLNRTVRWAETEGRRWAFTKTNAGARSTLDHFCDLHDLDRIDWEAVRANDFRPAEIKERKQAEFLLHGGFPCHLLDRIGVSCQHTLDAVRAALAVAPSTGRRVPLVEIRPDWYF